MRTRENGHRQYKYNVLHIGAIVTLVLSCLSANITLVQSVAADPPAQVGEASDTVKEESPPVPAGPLTVADKAHYYDITGTVDDAKALFVIKVGEEEVTSADSQPIIAKEPNEAGVYTWGYTIPERFKEGEYTISISAKTYDEEGKVTRELPLLTLVAQLTVAPPPQTPDPSSPLPVDTTKPDTTTPLPVVTTPLPFTPQIGQFVAPEVDSPAPGQPTITSTKLYGVPVDDLMRSSAPSTQSTTSLNKTNENTSTSPVAKSQKVGATSSSPAPIVDHASSSYAVSSPIETSSDGWRIFGTPWYWACLTVLVFTVGVLFVIRAVVRYFRTAPLGHTVVS